MSYEHISLLVRSYIYNYSFSIRVTRKAMDEKLCRRIDEVIYREREHMRNSLYGFMYKEKGG